MYDIVFFLRVILLITFLNHGPNINERRRKNLFAGSSQFNSFYYQSKYKTGILIFVFLLQIVFNNLNQFYPFKRMKTVCLTHLKQVYNP